jgi:hypothetical protein
MGLSKVDGLTLFPQTPAPSSSSSYMNLQASRVNFQGALSPTATEIASAMKYITEKMPDALRASPHSGLVRTFKFYHSLIEQYEHTADWSSEYTMFFENWLQYVQETMKAHVQPTKTSIPSTAGLISGASVPISSASTGSVAITTQPTPQLRVA